MITIHAVGDLVLEVDDSREFFQPSREMLRAADVTIGHLEIPHLHTGTVHSTDVPAIPGPPSALHGAAEAGIDIVSLAGNHIYDFGPDGMWETQEHCSRVGILTAGVGATIDEALSPTVVESKGQKLAVISVNCVGPRESWATTLKPGAAYVEITTHYEPRGANPGGPPRISTFAEPHSLQRVCEAIAHAREVADLVIVSLHKGLVHIPVDIADYEFEVAHAAIDAGAHAVLGHHAHIMRGIEFYKDAPIFHGLGNFITLTDALSGHDDDSPERVRWARERQRLFGFRADPAMPRYPFHPESRNTAIAVLDADTTDDSPIINASFIPCWIDDDGRPVPLTEGERFDQVATYIERITHEAGLATNFTRSPGRVHVRPAAE